ncbi:MAG: PAS domain S-box protein [Turneriella sp.]
MASTAGSDSGLLLQFIQALPEAAIITDKSGDVLATNEAWKKLSPHGGFFSDGGQGSPGNLKGIILVGDEPGFGEYEGKIAELFSRKADQISFFFMPKALENSRILNFVGSRIGLGGQDFFLIRFIPLFPQLPLADTLEAKFMETIADHIPLMIGILDRDLRYCYVNKFTTDYLNCSPNQILGKKFGEAFPESEVRSVRDIVQKTFDSGLAQKASLTLTAAGKCIWVETNFIPVCDSKKVPQNVLVMTQDITEQMNRQRDLNVARHSLHDILALMPVPYIAVSSDFKLASMNKAACGLFGYNEPEVLGRPIDIFLPEHFRKEHRGLMEKFSASATRTLAMENRNEIRAVRKDGSEISLLGTILKLEKENTVYYGLMLVDLTKIKSIEASLRDMQRRLMQAQKHEALGELAGNIAHDFNNLLGIISGYADLLQTILEGNTEALPMLDEILIAVKKGAVLTRQILAYTKGLEPQFRTVDLQQLLTDQVAQLQAAAGPDVAVELALEAQSGITEIDDTQIMQVLLNLIANAREAMDGAGSIVIGTTNALPETELLDKNPSLPATTEYIKLTVADNGRGMPADIMARIFDPYFSTKDQDQQKGTGLGLSMAKGIIRQHGGIVTCESQENVGTTFQIYLPLSPGSGAIPDSAGKTAAPGRQDVIPGNFHILIVEDEKGMREVVAAQLKSTGYQVYTAEDGSAALQFIDEFPGTLSLILSDVNMPGMSGFEMVEQAKLMQPEVSVLFMTGNPQEGEQAKRALSKHRLLKKPFDRETLLAELRNVLAAREVHP